MQMGIEVKARWMIAIAEGCLRFPSDTYVRKMGADHRLFMHYKLFAQIEQSRLEDKNEKNRKSGG